METINTFGNNAIIAKHGVCYGPSDVKTSNIKENFEKTILKKL